MAKQEKATDIPAASPGYARTNLATAAVIPERQKLLFVDSLRGLAALMVVVCHVAYIPTPTLQAPNAFLRLVNSGKAGVILFFIISAFTLCLSFEAHQSKLTFSHSRAFYLRRLFRIMPLFLLSVPIAWFRDFIVYNYPRPWPDTLSSALSVFSPYSHESVVWASWTLGVEMFFYLIFPLVFRTCSSLKRAIIFLAGCIAFDIFYSSLIVALARSSFAHGIYPSQAELFSSVDSNIRFSFLHNLQFFVIGIIMYYLYKNLVLQGRISARYGWLFIMLGLSSFLAFVFYFPLSLESVLYGRNLIIGFSCLAFAFGCSICHSKLVVFHWLAPLGIISYSLYLLHPPLIALLISSYSSIYSFGLSSALSYAICLALTLLILVPASWSTFHLIEKPGIILGKNLIKRL